MNTSQSINIELKKEGVHTFEDLRRDSNPPSSTLALPPPASAAASSFFVVTFIDPGGGFETGASLKDAFTVGGGFASSFTSSTPTSANEKLSYEPSSSSGIASYLRELGVAGRGGGKVRADQII